MSSAFPPARPFSRGVVRAHTAAGATAFDARAIEQTGVPQPVLMENAGRAAAQIAQRIFRPTRVLALVGSGNNGGDALVALRSLVAWGARGEAILISDRDPADPLLHGWAVEVRRDSEVSDPEWTLALERADLVIDGVLGTGVRGAPRTRQANAIVRLAAVDVPVLALDVPSGIDATTGAVPGAVVDADVTVAFGAPKTGALTHPGRAHVGRHVVVEIGFPPLAEEDASATVVTPAWARARLPRRPSDTHKNAVGRVLVVGGGRGMAGAVILAARAAFATGAGMVRVCADPENRAAVQSALPEAIFLGWDGVDLLADALEACDAVVMGPGLGTDDAAAGVARAVLEQAGGAVLLDADALNLVAAGRVALDREGGRGPLLVTPHPGEIERLSGPADTHESRIERARRTAERFGATVLFKGAPSVVVAPGGAAFIDTQGSSDLAVAGMGDMLSGCCGTLLAQGVGPELAGAVGLYVSGRAAVLAARGAGLTPSDVIDRIPDALTETADSVTDLDLPFVTFDADPAH